MKKILLTLSFLILVGCGYKPSAHYIKNVIDGTIYVNVIVDSKEPENAAYIKDALHQMILTRFKGSLAPKESAENVIVASYEGTSFTPISYTDGYITRYRAEIKMEFELKGIKKHFKRKIETQVEENITGSSRLSSSLRIEAIKRGMAKALDQFLAYASTNGILVEEAIKAEEAQKVEEARITS
ncbi:MAG: hypothetical protein JJV88_01465 [Sulfurovum sp.]|nr:hypothetical protein [Sulfurovaceae bacterium]